MKKFSVFVIFCAVFLINFMLNAAPVNSKEQYLTAKDLETLKKIHTLQMKLVKGKKTLPTLERDQMVKDLFAANETIKDKISKLKKFPCRGQLVDMHYVVVNYKNSGNKKYAKLTEDKILAEIQKVQLAEMQKAVAADAKKLAPKKPAPKKTAPKKTAAAKGAKK